jgi:hypothetical protein
MEKQIESILIKVDEGTMPVQQALSELLHLFNVSGSSSPDVMGSRFKKGDIVICWLKGSGYGDKFTVLADTGGLTLLCHKSGTLCIVNNRDDYEYA